MSEIQYANLHMHSDVEPFEIIRRIGSKTIEIREMNYERVESVELKWDVGGFAGHCINQNDQQWIITPDETAKPIRARLRKDGRYHSVYGKHIISDEPIRFYDYNF